MSDNAKDIDDLMCWLSSPPKHDWDERPSEQDNRYYLALDALVAERDGLRAELAAAIKQRDEAMDERSYWYREHSRLIEKLVSLEREDNERERLDAIERNDALAKWMDQVTAMLCHSMTHSHDAKQELVTRCDAAIAAMRKGER
jgi:hypothetical protein